MKLVQLYKQIKEENEGPVKVLVPRRSPEERKKNFLIATNKQIQEYIKNGSIGDLNLRNTPITSLPDNLTKVGGNLNLENTKITSLPDNLTEIGGHLLAEHSLITSLPDNLTIGGHLNLNFTPITSLPDNLTIKKSLGLQQTNVANLPKGLKVNFHLILYKTPISRQYTKEEIKQMVPGVKGDIFI